AGAVVADQPGLLAGFEGEGDVVQNGTARVGLGDVGQGELRCVHDEVPPGRTGGDPGRNGADGCAARRDDGGAQLYAVGADDVTGNPCAGHYARSGTIARRYVSARPTVPGRIHLECGSAWGADPPDTRPSPH